jgi:RNA polymerase sigma-70 factor (ECF subfamily)
MSDGELVRQTVAGHNFAYDELVRRWTARVLAICHARVGRVDVAEELAQEALVRGFKAIRSLSEPEKFGAWIGGIATRVCLDWLKDKDRSQVSLADQDFPDRHEEQDHEDLDRLMKEVERLPEKQREALMLYYYQDSTYEELGRLLGVSAATINARLTQARQMLRKRLVPNT